MPDKREQLIDIMQDAAKGETKEMLRRQIVALKAENERLKKAISEQIDRDISGIFPAEPAASEGQQDDDRIRREMDEILRKQSERDIPFAPSTRPAEQAVTEAAIMSAILDCPHEIDAQSIILRRSSKAEGHNALNQLHRRLTVSLKAAMEAGR